MTIQALMFDRSIPASHHIRITSGVFHGLSPSCLLTNTVPSVYHIFSPVAFALMEKKRTRPLDCLGQPPACLGHRLCGRGVVESLCLACSLCLAGRGASCPPRRTGLEKRRS